MDLLPVADVYRFAKLLVAAGDTFYVKRLLQRLDRGELTFSQAADLISATNAPTSPLACTKR